MPSKGNNRKSSKEKTAFSFYTNYEASTSHTVTEGGVDLTLALTAVPASGSLRYFTVQEFYESFGYPLDNSNTELIRSIEIIRVGLQIEAQIDELLGSKFDDNDGSYHAKTEYIDTYELNDTYFLNATPIISLTSIRTTQSDEDTAPDISIGTWTTLTSNTDFVTDLNTGRIIIVTSAYKPISRKNGLYASYTYGRASVPKDIQRLAILMVMYHFAQGSILKNRIMGRNTGSTQDLSLVKQEIDSIIEHYNILDQQTTP